MANTIQFKRRQAGNAGAPAALKSGEVAHNEVDDTLYIGKGDDGGGNATAIVPLAGAGGFVARVGSQTIGGAKTFAIAPKSSQDASGSTDLVRKSQFDAGLAGKAAATHGHAISEVSGLQVALDGKAADSHSHAIADVTGVAVGVEYQGCTHVSQLYWHAHSTDSHWRDQHNPACHDRLCADGTGRLWRGRHAQIRL